MALTTGWEKQHRVWLYLVLALSLSAFAPAQAQQVVGTSAIVTIDDYSITTFSATELDYVASAYYDAYVEGYLFQNGGPIGWGSASSGSESNIAYGYMTKPVVYGAQYLRLSI